MIEPIIERVPLLKVRLVVAPLRQRSEFYNNLYRDSFALCKAKYVSSLGSQRSTAFRKAAAASGRSF